MSVIRRCEGKQCIISFVLTEKYDRLGVNMHVSVDICTLTYASVSVIALGLFSTWTCLSGLLPAYLLGRKGGEREKRSLLYQYVGSSQTPQDHN